MAATWQANPPITETCWILFDQLMEGGLSQMLLRFSNAWRRPSPSFRICSDTRWILKAKLPRN